MDEFLVSDEVLEVDKNLAIRLGLNNAIIYSCSMKERTTNANHLSKILTFFSKSTIKRSIAHLKAAGFLKEESREPEELKSRVINGHHLKDKTCEWCEGRSMVLHEHHYPIPRRLGGKDVVNICPNCHYGYHYLEKDLLK